MSLQSLGTLVLHFETNTDPKGWFVGEIRDLILDLIVESDFFFRTQKIMGNILIKMAY